MNCNKESRGIRNNNPLNIRRNPANQWQGLRPVQADKLFCQFKAMKWGLRAAIRLMENYIRRGAQTPRQIISRWAPPSENNTSGYITQACQRAGLDPDFPVLFWADLRKLIKAMSWIESRFLPLATRHIRVDSLHLQMHSCLKKMIRVYSC